MEELRHQETADDDDEDYGQFAKQGKRSKRLVISDDEEEADSCDVAGAANGNHGGARETSTDDGALVPATASSTGSGMDGTVELSDGADSDNESVQYDVADLQVEEVGRQGSAATSANHSLRLGLASGDIFDDEISDGDNSQPGLSRQDTCTDVRDDRLIDIDNSSDDDVNKGFDESQVDPSLLAKLKRMKGASKSGQNRQKYARKAKPKAEEMLEIYSESQRLLRDSRVNLPYYEPEPKQLEDFLARAVKKKQEYAGLRRAKDIQKAQIICDRLSLSPHLLPSANKPKLSSPQCESDRRTAKSAPSDCQLNSANNLQPSLQRPSLNCSSERLVSPVEKAGIDSVAAGGDDELPDLLPVPNSMERSFSVPETACDPESLGTRATATGISTYDISHQNDVQVSTPLLRKDPSRDLFKSQNSTIDEQPHSLHGQDRDLQICGIAEASSTLDHLIEDNCSSGHLNVSDSTSVRESIESIVGDHVPVDCTDNSSERHDTSASHTCTADTFAESSSLLSISVTSCSHSAVGKVSDSSSVMTPVGRPARHKLLDRLQGISLPESPSLSATPDGVICLDDAHPSPVAKAPGLVKLMNRLVEHSKNSTTPVTGRILDDRKDPETACITETGEAVETSGYKLDRLKQQLGFGMREKRAESRRRRYDQFALDNEEGFGEEDEEEEMESEGSDTDNEEEAAGARPSDSGEDGEDNDSEDEEGLDDDCKIDLQANDDDDDEDYNPYLDTEAHDDDDDEEQDKSSDVCLHFDVSDEEEHTLQDTDRDGQNKLDSHARDNTNNLYLSTSEEDSGDESRDTVILPARERGLSSNLLESDDDNGGADDNGDDITNEPQKPRPGSKNKKKDVVSSLRQQSSETSPLTALLKDTSRQAAFRRENSESPDLYSARMHDQNVSSTSQLSNFADTNLIKYLDDDGFIKLNESQQTSKVFQLPRTQNNDPVQGSPMFETTCPMSAGHIFHGLATQDFGKGDSHIVNSSLSSGAFIPCTAGSQLSLEDDDDDDVLDPFHVLSGAEDDVAHKHHEKKEKAVLTDSDDDDDDAESDTEDDGNDDLQHDTDDKEKERSQMTKLKKKRTFRMKDFVEDEAELSGSDYDSDENVDVAEEDDILEEEAGDLDLQGVSDEKLRDEVGRLHMKQLRDDDDRALMRYKEMYLQDGDLYSEGVGRMRNFRWKDVDYQSDEEKLRYNSDDDQAEDEAEDALWRKDRFEREKFLEEKDFGPATDGGQLIQLGQVFLQKQESIPQATENVTVSSLAKPLLPKPQQLKKKGSFLSRGKASLGKIAEVVQTTHGSHASKNSRNFLFQTVDGPKDDDGKTDKPQSSVAGKRKAHTSCTPEAGKKAKLADMASTAAGGKPGQPQRQSSIFDLFQDV